MSTIEAIFRVALDVSWRSSVLIVAVLVIRAALQHRVPAWVVHAAWIAVAIRMLMPVSFEAAWSPLGGTTHGNGVLTSSANDLPDAHAVVPGAVDSLSILEPSLAPSEIRLTPVQWCAVVWLAGAAALLLVRFAAHGRFMRALRGSSSPGGPRLVDAMERVATERGVRPVEVWEGDAIPTPALYGMFRPRLLFPRGMADQLAPSALRMIVAHELAHLDRRDLITQSLMRAAAALHWFNPLVWIAARATRNDCELACDESVMRRLNRSQRETYGSTLIQVASLARSGRQPFGLGVVESRNQLKRRIQMIAHQHPSAPIRAAIGVTAFLAIAVVSLSKESGRQSADAAQAGQKEQAAKLELTGQTEQSVKRADEARALAEAREAGQKEAAEKAADEVAKMQFRYDAESDGLDNRFPGGVIATVGDRTITVSDVRREAERLIPQLQRESSSQEDFDRRLRMLQNDIAGHLLNRVLVVDQFHEHSETIPEKHVAAKYVDEAIADVTKDRFDNDPAKLAASLAARGITMEQYRREVEEDIIYGYMKAQERKLLNKPHAKSADSGS